jgi:hypothetical protein
MAGGFDINMERTWTVVQFVPGIQGIVRYDGSAVHGDSVAQQTKNCKTCQKTDSHSRIRLLVPPSLGDS